MTPSATQQRVAGTRAPADVLAIGALAVVSSAVNALPRDMCSPVLMALTLFILPFHRITRGYCIAVWPLFAILCLGCIGVAGHEFRDVARDLFFALTPIALILVGYWLADRKWFWHQLPVALVWLGVVFALKHLSAFALKPSLLLAESMIVRAGAGNVPDVTVLGFLILLFINRFTPDRRPMRGLAYWLPFVILLASVVLSYSRTAVVVITLGVMASRGWLIRRNLKWPTLLLMLAVAVLLTLQTGGRESEELTFTSKLARSLEELAISNYETMSDISLNWRGFETYKTLEQYASGSTLQLAIGQGFGALVDLGFYMPLGGDASIDFRYIPVTHNGYGYVLLKYGAVGIILYLSFYAKLVRTSIRYQNSPSAQSVFLARLLLGITLALAFVMFVGGGMAELVNSELVVLVGVLLRRLALNNQELSRAARHEQQSISKS